MSLATPGLQVEIAVANMDWYPAEIPGRHRPSWEATLDQIESYLEQTRCRNIELHPVSARLAQQIHNSWYQLAKGERVDRLIGSLHQQFTIPGVIGTAVGMSKLRAPEEELGRLKGIQACLSRRVPAVVYPEKLPKYVLNPGSKLTLHDFWRRYGTWPEDTLNT